MICSIIGQTVLYGGCIVRIESYPEKVKLRLEGNITAEFRNGTKPRADYIKRLGIVQGDSIILVGGYGKTDRNYILGWELFANSGIVKCKNQVLITGDIEKILKGEEESVLIINSGRESFPVKINNTLMQKISKGRQITLQCYLYKKETCQGSCKTACLKRCLFCKYKNKVTERLVATQISVS